MDDISVNQTTGGRGRRGGGNVCFDDVEVCRPFTRLERERRSVKGKEQGKGDTAAQQLPSLRIRLSRDRSERPSRAVQIEKPIFISGITASQCSSMKSREGVRSGTCVRLQNWCDTASRREDEAR